MLWLGLKNMPYDLRVFQLNSHLAKRSLWGGRGERGGNHPLIQPPPSSGWLFLPSGVQIHYKLRPKIWADAKHFYIWLYCPLYANGKGRVREGRTSSHPWETINKGKIDERKVPCACIGNSRNFDGLLRTHNVSVNKSASPFNIFSSTHHLEGESGAFFNLFWRKGGGTLVRYKAFPTPTSWGGGAGDTKCDATKPFYCLFRGDLKIDKMLRKVMMMELRVNILPSISSSPLSKLSLRRLLLLPSDECTHHSLWAMWDGCGPSGVMCEDEWCN